MRLPRTRERAVIARRLRAAAACLLILALPFISAFTVPPQAETVIAAQPSVVDDPRAYLPPGTAYARVTADTPVYASLADVRAARPYRRHGGEAAWVNVQQSREVDGSRYYYVRWDWGAAGWMPGEALRFSPVLSRLRGVDLRERPDEHLAMVYVDALNVRSEPGVLTEQTRLGALARYDLVSVQEQRAVNGALWYRIGEGQWIHSGYVRDLTPGERPAGVGADEQWIEVDLRRQTAFAHEGDTPVYATLTSTGRPGRETVTGLFRPWIKLRAAPMRGARFDLEYDLAAVPWMVYFHGSYAWHGVYWHDRFGTPQSAGCVNLSPHDAHWFFHWSQPDLPAGSGHVRPTAEQPGTWVYIY